MCRKSTLYSCSKRPLYSSGRDSKGRTRTPDQPRFPAPALQISLSGTRTRHLVFRHPHFKPRFPASLLHTRFPAPAFQTSHSGSRTPNLAFGRAFWQLLSQSRFPALQLQTSLSGTCITYLAFQHLHRLQTVGGSGVALLVSGYQILSTESASTSPRLSLSAPFAKCVQRLSTKTVEATRIAPPHARKHQARRPRVNW